MRKSIYTLSAILFSMMGFSQSPTQPNNDDQKTGTKKIETIKVVDGDTVLHEIRMVKTDGNRHPNNGHTKMQWKDMSADEEMEVDSIFENVEMYMHLEDDHKKRIIRRIHSDSDDFEMLVKEIGSDEDVVIEMDRNGKKMKIIKVEIDDESGKEISVIEMDGKGNQKAKQHPHAAEALKVYPNPADNELTIEFEVPEKGEVKLNVISSNGTEIFSKSYSDAGKVKEKIQTKDAEKGVYVVNLSQKGRKISRKILLE